MASPEQIAEVRANTGEEAKSSFSDTVLDDLINIHGVTRASAIVWERKAAEWAELVNTSEAGASRSLSDLSKNALGMATLWNTKVASTSTTKATRTRRITR